MANGVRWQTVVGLVLLITGLMILTWLLLEAVGL